MALPASLSTPTPGNDTFRLVDGINPSEDPRVAAEKAIATEEYGIQVDLRRAFGDRLTVVHGTQGYANTAGTAQEFHNSGVQRYYARVLEKIRVAKQIALAHVDSAITEARELTAFQQSVGTAADVGGFVVGGELTAAEAVGIARKTFMSNFENLRGIVDQLYHTIIAASEARMGKVAPGALEQAGPMGWSIDAGEDLAPLGATKGTVPE